MGTTMSSHAGLYFGPGRQVPKRYSSCSCSLFLFDVWCLFVVVFYTFIILAKFVPIGGQH